MYDLDLDLLIPRHAKGWSFEGEGKYRFPMTVLNVSR